MAKPNINRWDDFRVARRWRGIRRWISVGLFLLFFAGVNGLSSRCYYRHDGNGMAMLPRRWLALARSLDSPLGAVVVRGDGGSTGCNEDFFRAAFLFLENVKDLFRRNGLNFDYAVSHGPRQLPSLQPAGAPSPPASGIYLQTGTKVCPISPTSCTVFRAGHLRGFSFFDAFGAALEALGDPVPMAVYFLRGHGERSPQMQPFDLAISRLKLYLGKLGWRGESLEISRLLDVDPIHSVVLLADPRIPLSPSECVTLHRFLEEKQGRMLVMLTHQSHHGLDDWLDQWQVKVDENGPREYPSQFDEGISVCRLSASAPFLQPLIDHQLPVQFDSLRVVAPTGNGHGDFSIQVLPLMEATGTGDNPFPVAVAIERRSQSNFPIDLPSGKLVVVGGDFLSNRYFSLLGNQLFFHRLLTYFFPGDTVTPSPEPEGFQLPLSRSQVNAMGRTLVFASLVPLFLILVRHLFLRNGE
jgi:hypothetical protein